MDNWQLSLLNLNFFIGIALIADKGKATVAVILVALYGLTFAKHVWRAMK